SNAWPSERFLTQRRFSICCIAELDSAGCRSGPTRCSFPTRRRLQICDTAERGEAATKGARVCDPQELCGPPSVITNPALWSLPTCCGSQSRAPQNRRDPRRFGQILIDYTSATPGDDADLAANSKASFPLTLALSPGERENRAPFQEHSNASRQSAVFPAALPVELCEARPLGAASKHGSLSPLPEGEGQ